eukprot:CAMPEP_0114243912 /NCGR_PEP_ID=MMETSP0058-20121206/11050_1 /TAXON_ID=36894 /ORGANISM="Pyramimonas parkeae, CCMP726" /LENGTH=786 /DNA_ID=CAMNT_0001356799 /DNA_START=207 /DNA_END=2568 /DNA_ORIENTATION=+
MLDRSDINPKAPQVQSILSEGSIDMELQHVVGPEQMSRAAFRTLHLSRRQLILQQQQHPVQSVYRTQARMQTTDDAQASRTSTSAVSSVGHTCSTSGATDSHPIPPTRVGTCAIVSVPLHALLSQIKLRCTQVQREILDALYNDFTMNMVDRTKILVLVQDTVGKEVVGEALRACLAPLRHHCQHCHQDHVYRPQAVLRRMWTADPQRKKPQEQYAQAERKTIVRFWNPNPGVFEQDSRRAAICAGSQPTPIRCSPPTAGNVEAPCTFRASKRLPTKEGRWAELPESVMCHVLAALNARRPAKGMWEEEDEGEAERCQLADHREARRASAVVRQVCSSWRALHDFNLAELAPSGAACAEAMRWAGRFLHVRTLSLGLCPDTGDADMAVRGAAAFLPNLKELQLRKCAGTDARALRAVSNETLKTASALTALERLDLAGCRVMPGLRDQGAWALGGFPALTALNLTGCTGLTNDGLKALRGGALLASVALPNCKKISDEAVRNLVAGSPALTALDLRMCVKLTDAALQSLSTLSGLASLRLDRCTKVTDEGVAALSLLPGLTSLSLAGCARVTDASARALARRGRLTGLDARGCAGITEAGVCALAGIACLASLRLGGAGRLSEEGVRALSRLPGLHTLSLHGCYYVTVAGLRALGLLTALRTLSLHGSMRLTRDGMRTLGGLSSLTHLSLAESRKMTDDGARELGRLSALTNLSLSKCPLLSDVAVEVVAGLPKLRSVNLGLCRRVTDKGVSAQQTCQSYADWTSPVATKSRERESKRLRETMRFV